MVRRRLQGLSDADDDYWTFRRDATRRNAHGLSQYPAMMVPLMQEVLLAVVSETGGDVRRVLDPFVGSGTTLVECMRRGLDFSGQDINPLAVLICRAKAGPLDVARLQAAAAGLKERVAQDRSKLVDITFSGLPKWFSPAAAESLARIRRAILSEPDRWCRQVFWVALAETVRVTSNSRTSTFKLHIRAQAELLTRRVCPAQVFPQVVSDVVQRLAGEDELQRKAGFTGPDGSYKGKVRIRLGDSSQPIDIDHDGLHDLLITSPPYGDNTSTVPYGQYSYLPLQWIAMADIDVNADDSYLATTHAIDSKSLGGSRKQALQDTETLRETSPSFARTMDALAHLPADRAKRVASFCRDLNRTLDPILAALRRNAYMIWTVGNRRVGERPVPINSIITELLEARGASMVAQIQRTIPNKRMATKNAIAATMREENILVLRRR